jgi:hypothetical protein
MASGPLEQERVGGEQQQHGRAGGEVEQVRHGLLRTFSTGAASAMGA